MTRKKNHPTGGFLYSGIPRFSYFSFSTWTLGMARVPEPKVIGSLEGDPAVSPLTSCSCAPKDLVTMKPKENTKSTDVTFPVQKHGSACPKCSAEATSKSQANGWHAPEARHNLKFLGNVADIKSMYCEAYNEVIVCQSKNRVLRFVPTTQEGVDLF